FVVLYLLRFDCFYCSFSVHAFADISPLSLHDALPISWAGFQRFCVAPHSFEPADPCTISMATKRVRSDSAMPSFHALPAGAIASRNGSATVAPIPLRKVRRGSCFWVRNISGSPGSGFLLSPSICGLACPAAALSLPRLAVRFRDGFGARHPEGGAVNHYDDAR